ncbi:hypothetical protein MTO96_019550 [Rhipicephalus appendiculatus]
MSGARCRFRPPRFNAKFAEAVSVPQTAGYASRLPGFTPNVLRVVEPEAMSGCAAEGRPEEGHFLLFLGCRPVPLPKVQQRRDSHRTIAPAF